MGISQGASSTWTDEAIGKIVSRYTMLTLNADHHPLMSRMHKPDPKLGPDAQDKRSVVAIEAEDVDRWLFGTVEEAARLVRVPEVGLFEAGPA